MESKRVDPDCDVPLRRLLGEWEVEGAPGALDGRVRGFRQPWFGSVRVPLPVAAAFVLVLIAMAVALLRTPRQPPRQVTLADFQSNDNIHVRIIEGRP